MKSFACSKRPSPNPVEIEMEALLPCPFCGLPPTINRIEPHTHSGLLKELGIPDHPGSVVIECICGCGLLDATQEAVTARWNRRDARTSLLSMDRLIKRSQEMATSACPEATRKWHEDEVRAVIKWREMTINDLTPGD